MCLKFFILVINISVFNFCTNIQLFFLITKYFLNYFLLAKRIITANTIIQNNKPKITGDITQNQDHVIILVSLRTIKTIVSKPTNPIPPDELLELLELLISLFFFIFCIVYGIRTHDILLGYPTLKVWWPRPLAEYDILVISFITINKVE